MQTWLSPLQSGCSKEFHSHNFPKPFLISLPNVDWISEETLSIYWFGQLNKSNEMPLLKPIWRGFHGISTCQTLTKSFSAQRQRFFFKHLEEKWYNANTKKSWRDQQETIINLTILKIYSYGRRNLLVDQQWNGHVLILFALDPLINFVGTFTETRQIHKNFEEAKRK